MAFTYLDKTEKERWLPQLFDLLHENMQVIAPSGLPYGQEKEDWLAAVSPALEKAPRQIILCFVAGELAGFVQYYVRGKSLMVEEMQLKKQYHRTALFGSFCRYLLSVMPEDLQTVEAYADKRNLHSIQLMEKLGMRSCEPETDPPFVHMRGPAEMVCRRFSDGTWKKWK